MVETRDASKKQKDIKINSACFITFSHTQGESKKWLRSIVVKVRV
jgi:hypothetical protein